MGCDCGYAGVYAGKRRRRVDGGEVRAACSGAGFGRLERCGGSCEGGRSPLSPLPDSGRGLKRRNASTISERERGRLAYARHSLVREMYESYTRVYERSGKKMSVHIGRWGVARGLYNYILFILNRTI